MAPFICTKSACCISPGVSVRSDLKPAVSGFSKKPFQSIPQILGNYTQPSYKRDHNKPLYMCPYEPISIIACHEIFWRALLICFNHFNPFSSGCRVGPLPRDRSRSASSAWMLGAFRLGGKVGRSNVKVKFSPKKQHFIGFLVLDANNSRIGWHEPMANIIHKSRWDMWRCRIILEESRTWKWSVPKRNMKLKIEIDEWAPLQELVLFNPFCCSQTQCAGL